MSTTLRPPAGDDAAAMGMLRDMIEENFAAHTAQLTELTVYGRMPGHGGYDPLTLEEWAAHHRREIADSADALRRMADGTYGLCRTCHHAIPAGLLRAVPHAERCVPCRRLP
jgi:DnaK suppressor protein